MSAGGVASMPVVRIHVGWCPETELITSDMRARDEATDTYFAVTNAQDIEGRRKVITLTCTESAPS